MHTSAPYVYGMLGGMVRTTIYLPEQVKRDLETRARREGRTESDILREALAAALGGQGTSIRDLSFGEFDSGRSDTSERVDEILADSGFGASWRSLPTPARLSVSRRS